MMGQSLNTTVNGSSGTCREAAEHLRALYQAASQAGTDLASARRTANQTWHGPAHDLFNEATGNFGPDIDAVDNRAFKAEWALRNFADELDGVLAKMDHALGTAHAGGLQVHGPFIVSAEHPGPAPSPPSDPIPPEKVDGVMGRFQQDQVAYNQTVADYNAKAAVFNECKGIVAGARKQEGNAHDALTQAMGQASDAMHHDLGEAGFVFAAQARNVTGNLENERRLAQAASERYQTQSTFYEKFALGKQATYPDYAKGLLDRSAKLAGDGGKMRARANEFGKFVETLPEGVREKITDYPGKNVAESQAKHSKEAKLPSGVGKLARALPYAGATITAFSESYDALKGEQSWGRAGADFTGVTVGGALGSTAALLAVGATGPLGATVVGVLGGVGGSMVGTDIVEGIFGGGDDE